MLRSRFGLHVHTNIESDKRTKHGLPILHSQNRLIQLSSYNLSSLLRMSRFPLAAVLLLTVLGLVSTRR